MKLTHGGEVRVEVSRILVPGEDDGATQVESHLLVSSVGGGNCILGVNLVHHFVWKDKDV